MKAEGTLDAALAKHGNPTGQYYNLIVKSVNEVLADPGKYHPAYDKDEGYEIAGFVWFQGFNDLVGPYPGCQRKGRMAQDYSEYSRLMACFIRDIRKDLKVPEMPFVIGVMGIGGVRDTENQHLSAKPRKLRRPCPSSRATSRPFGRSTTGIWNCRRSMTS